MIKIESDFYRRVQSCIAPIYFFEEKAGQSKDTEKSIINGTLTLFRTSVKIFGITNYHVYEQGYLVRKQNNENVICQIGHKLRICLEERIIHENKGQDLIVFFLYEYELRDIAKDVPKSGFRIINSNIEKLLESQKEEDVNTWAMHVVGFSGVYKTIERINSGGIKVTFDAFWYPSFVRHSSNYNPNEEQIILHFFETRNALKDGRLQMTKGILSEELIDFGGISGAPVFARCFPYQDDLALLGIVYEGHASPEGFLPEVIYAKPIGLIKNILQG